MKQNSRRLKHEDRQDETKNDRGNEDNIEELAQHWPVVNFKGSEIYSSRIF